MFRSAQSRIGSNSEKYQKRVEKFGSEDVMPLWVADMDIETPSFILKAIKKRLDHPFLGYEQMPKSAFIAQADWMRERYDFDIDISDLLYSPSILTSINLAIKAFTKKGDKIIIQSPIYPAFMTSIVDNERVVLDNPLKSNYKFDLKDLEDKIDKDTKLLLLCSPHNPVGIVWEKEELKSLAKLCKKHDIIVVSDEIHSDLSFSKHTPFAKVYKKTITLLSPTKTFNISGLQISTIHIKDKTLKDIFKKTYKSTNIGEANVLSHVAFEIAYKEGKAWLNQLLNHIQTNINKLHSALPQGISFQKPQATYLVWLDCRDLGVSEDKLEKLFIKAKLGLSKGSSYSKDYDRFMRINLAVSSKQMDEIVKRLETIKV